MRHGEINQVPAPLMLQDFSSFFVKFEFNATNGLHNVGFVRVDATRRPLFAERHSGPVPPRLPLPRVVNFCPVSSTLFT
jgi:hypothetical protein